MNHAPVSNRLKFAIYLSMHGSEQSRLDASNNEGGKVLTPIRPVVCLKQNLDLGETSVRLV